MHICTLDLLHSIALFSLFSGGVRGGKALKKKQQLNTNILFNFFAYLSKKNTLALTLHFNQFSDVSFDFNNFIFKYHLFISVYLLF